MRKRIETESEYYYDILNIYERFSKEVVDKYETLYKAAKKINKSRAYLYSTYRVGTIKKFLRLCQDLDIDFDYCISGKNNSHHFNGRTISYEKLVSVYKNNRYKQRYNNSIKVIMSKIKCGRDNIKIATLLYLSELFKTNPLDII